MQVKSTIHFVSVPNIVLYYFTVETPNSIQCDGKFTYSLASLHCLMHNDLVVVLSVMALLVLPPLALASFLSV